jgi:probable rRNA maturation factor
MDEIQLHVEISADSKFPVNRKMIRERILAVLKRQEVSGKVEVSVLVVGDRKMAQLNKHYRGKVGTTDVLSFPTHDPSQDINDGGFIDPKDLGLVLGDIVVSYPQAVDQAMKKNSLLDEVVCDLVEHSMMHLLGIHHPE